METTEGLTELLKAVEKIGIPVLFCIVILVIAYKMIPMYLTSMQNHFNNKNEILLRQQSNNELIIRQHQEQMKTITAIAQESIEVSKRSNIIIERNTELCLKYRITQEQLKESFDFYAVDIQNTKELVREALEMQQSIYTALMRLNDKMK